MSGDASSPDAAPAPGGGPDALISVHAPRPGAEADGDGGSAVEAFLAAAREGLDRLTPTEVAELRDARTEPEDDELSAAPSLLLVDIRPFANRAAEGEIPGAIPVERIHLEWRLAPDSPWRIPQVTSDTRVVVFCNEGYASSLAARDLRRLGLLRATDLVGGFRAWSAAGLPVVPGGSPAVP